MPFAVLIVVALTAGGLAYLLARRYPATAAAEAPARAASGMLAAQARERRWLAQLLRQRLDASTATGLALTIALGMAILGGLVVGVLAYLMRTNATLVNVDNSVGQWELDHASALSTYGLRAVTQLGGTYAVIALIAVVSIIEYRRVPSRWIPVFLLTVLVGVDLVAQEHDRIRPLDISALEALRVRPQRIGADAKLVVRGRQRVRDLLRVSETTRAEDEACAILASSRADDRGRSRVVGGPGESPVEAHLVGRRGPRIEALYQDECVMVPLDVEGSRAVSEDLDLAGAARLEPQRRRRGSDIAKHRADDDLGLRAILGGS